MAMQGSRGFSLLEVLVVVVIIGILASMMTLSIGFTSGDRELEQEVERLEALLDLASEDAVLQGREIGLRFYPNAYEFSALDPDENLWQVIATDPLLRQRRLSPDIELLLTIEGRSIDLERSLDDREDELQAQQEEDEDEASETDNGYQPQVYLFSSGDLSPPFALEVRRRFGDLTLTIDVDEAGEVEVLREDF